MKRYAWFVGLLSTLTIPAPTYALRHVIVGNATIGPGGFDTEVLAAANVQERVYLEGHDGSLTLYFKGGPKA
jgi:hypothetical protein